MNTSCTEGCGLGVSEICNLAVAAGTMLLALAAIYGDWLKSKFFPPKVALELRSELGDITTVKNGVTGQIVGPAMYYHVRVINLRRSIPITNCRVSIRALEKRMPDGQFKPIPMSVPLDLRWAPAEANEPVVTITSERILDLGHLIQAEKQFRPAVRVLSHNFKGIVKAGESIRFGLWVDATNYSSASLTFFEVTWNGEFSEDPETFAQYLVVKKV